MADTNECLDSLRTLVRVSRAEFMEKMAKGLESDDSYREITGRCKAYADVIEKITAQIRNLNGDDGDQDAPTPSTFGTNKRGRAPYA
jgi:hypothetical protein